MPLRITSAGSEPRIVRSLREETQGTLWLLVYRAVIDGDIGVYVCVCMCVCMYTYNIHIYVYVYVYVYIYEVFYARMILRHLINQQIFTTVPVHTAGMLCLT